jgi:hypothetical protein
MSELTLPDAEALARRALAMIDANAEAIRRAARVALTDRHDTDRSRIADDLDGLRTVENLAGLGLPEPAAGEVVRLRTTFSDGLLRTAALYGVRP